MLAKCAFVNNDFTLAQDFQYANDGGLMDMTSDPAIARQRAFASTLKNGLQSHSSLEYSGVCAILANANHFILAQINPLQSAPRKHSNTASLHQVGVRGFPPVL